MDPDRGARWRRRRRSSCKRRAGTTSRTQPGPGCAGCDGGGGICDCGGTWAHSRASDAASTQGRSRGITVIDDYAHHPLEIEATIAAARERYPGRGELWPLFNRTPTREQGAMLEPFAAALPQADVAWCWTSTRRGRRIRSGCRPTDMFGRFPTAGRWQAANRREAVERLASESSVSGDIVLTMGAGDVTLVGPALLTLLEDRLEREASNQRYSNPGRAPSEGRA